LYRKIAWDDTYQRWVLPDMMRYFTLKILIAEFRTFHMSTGSTTDAVYTVPPEKPTNNQPLYLRILDDIFPTWEITCELCEFDIENLSFEYLPKLSVAEPTQATVKFAVKVGNIKELQIYPYFENMYLSDRKLNGPNRAKDEISTIRDANNRYAYPASLHIAQDREGPTEFNFHTSGTPYGEFQNDPNIINMYGPMNLNKDGRVIKSPPQIIYGQRGEVVNVIPEQPETWVGNTVTWGASFAKNAVKTVVDKAKTTEIPQMGVSFTEIKTALQSVLLV
jgi:hypothetical protein